MKTEQTEPRTTIDGVCELATQRIAQIDRRLAELAAERTRLNQEKYGLARLAKVEQP
jgi:hypothetical protein